MPTTAVPQVDTEETLEGTEDGTMRGDALRELLDGEQVVSILHEMERTGIPLSASPDHPFQKTMSRTHIGA